jgi:hypothetical protein
MDAKKRIAAHGVQFFIHRSRVQKLYRNFLRICETNEERRQVREEFMSNKQMNASSLKEAEAILKRLQLARGAPKPQMPHHLTHHSQQVLSIIKTIPTIARETNIGSVSSVRNSDTTLGVPEESVPAPKIEWPWQRKDN